MILEGWIEESGDGSVSGRFVDARGDEVWFKGPIEIIDEAQRVYLEPGVYFYIVNGRIVINNAIWTTHDMEQADIEAKRLQAALHLT
jgi:hypothetical protein